MKSATLSMRYPKPWDDAFKEAARRSGMTKSAYMQAVLLPIAEAVMKQVASPIVRAKL